MKIFYIIFVKFYKKIVQIFFPPKCVICKNENNIFNIKSLCHICEKNLKISKYFIKKDLPEWINYKYQFQDINVKKIEYNMKYFHNRDLCSQMGKYVYNFLYMTLLQRFEILDQFYILLPVPISKNRKKERGYNQAKVIAMGIDKYKVFEIIKRNINTKKLFNLNQEERSAIISEAFTIDEDEILKLKRYLNKIFLNTNQIEYNIFDINIVIIDDITTTGATFYNIKKTLIKYGFHEDKIFAFALAH